MQKIFTNLVAKSFVDLVEFTIYVIIFSWFIAELKISLEGVAVAFFFGFLSGNTAQYLYDQRNS